MQDQREKKRTRFSNKLATEAFRRIRNMKEIKQDCKKFMYILFNVFIRFLLKLI